MGKEIGEFEEKSFFFFSLLFFSFSEVINFEEVVRRRAARFVFAPRLKVFNFQSP